MVLQGKVVRSGDDPSGLPMQGRARLTEPAVPTGHAARRPFE